MVVSLYGLHSNSKEVVAGILVCFPAVPSSLRGVSFLLHRGSAHRILLVFEPRQPRTRPPYLEAGVRPRLSFPGVAESAGNRLSASSRLTLA